MPAADAIGRRSKHLLIALDLNEKIQAGTYPPGGRLPGENELAAEHEVSTGTARQAISLLVSWGVAKTRHGAGVFVRDFRPVVREGSQVRGETRRPGRSIWAEVSERNHGIDQIGVVTATPPAHVRDILGLKVDQLAVRRSRRFLIDGKPVMLVRSWISDELAANTPIADLDAGPGGIYGRLRDLGHALTGASEDLRARMPLPDESDSLELTAGTPVMVIVRTAYDQDGTPIEVSDMIADADAYVFRYWIDVFSGL